MNALNESITSLYSSDTTDVNTMWEHFKDTLHTSLKSHLPHMIAKKRDGYQWIGPELKKLIRKQHRLYKLKNNNNRRSNPQAEIPGDQAPSTEAYPTGLLGNVQSIVTPQEKETEYTSMKRFWSFIKHKRSGNVGVSSLKKDRKLYSHPLCKAELLNKQFQSVFTRSDE